jgi:hypothetical protein
MTAIRDANRTAKRPPQGFSDPAVKAAFDQHPPAIKARLLALRQLIFETAAGIEGVGPLQETLKWNQPSYLTSETKSGSTIRLDRMRATEQYALFFHCQTDLVATFRELYPTELSFEGNRSIVLHVDDPVPEQALSHCVGLALTYHLRKRRPSTRSSQAE